MLLRWGCCYVEYVFTLKMLKMLLCWKRGMCILPTVVWRIITFSWDPWKHFYQHATLLVSTKQHNMKNLKNLKLIKTAGNIPPGMLSACWSRSMCDHVPWRPQHIVNRSEKWHFQISLHLHFNCVPGNLKPLSYIYIFVYTYMRTCLYIYIYIYIHAHPPSDDPAYNIIWLYCPHHPHLYLSFSYLSYWELSILHIYLPNVL